jgi:hypothetical protein
VCGFIRLLGGVKSSALLSFQRYNTCLWKKYGWPPTCIFYFLSNPNLEIKDIPSKNKLCPQVCISINIIIRAKLILSCYLFIILLIVFYFIIFLIYLFFNFIHDYFIAFIFSI